MYRKNLILSAALSAVCFVASQATLTPAASASVFPLSVAAGHMSVGNKTVKLSIANSGTETLNLMVGTQAMTVEPGKTIEVKAMAGTNITLVNDTHDHKAGDVLAQVTKDLGGATIRIS